MSTRSLVRLLKKRLFLAVVLLIFSFVLVVSVGVYASINQYNLSQQKINLHDDMNGMLSSMIDQETGLRGYISTANASFLQPYNDGRPQYLHYAQQFQKHIASGSNFDNVHGLLVQVNQRADAWYNNFAQVQIQKIHSGDLVTPRSTASIATGKADFDRFRSTMTQLQIVTDQDLNNAQIQMNTIDLIIIVVACLLLASAIFGIWYTFHLFGGQLRDQMNVLMDVATEIASGDLSARVEPLTHQELNKLGETFNMMAEALQQQQNALRERDVLENVLQLNTTLTTGLDLHSLLEEFLKKVLNLLDVQLGALFLYDPSREVLSLFAVQGFNMDEMQRESRLGEGFVGRAALYREPILLSQAAAHEAEGFKAQTMLGLVLPATLYHLPLIRGNELIGVLAVGSIYPMSEKARNVLKVVSSNLAAAISNIRSYERIQEQAEELERRSKQQEQTTMELRRQRDELTTLNSALEEANRTRSQFLSTMSHELRTPLTAIIGFSQILLRDAEKNPMTARQKTNVERILKNGKHLLSLINDVLDLAKIESGRMDVSIGHVNLAELLTSVADEMQSIAADTDISLQVSVDEDVQSIETDPVKLRQILLNLVSNALKFTEHGEVKIAARHVPASGLEPEYIAISVKDTGVGIPAEIQERIFDAFYQADSSNTRRYGGTGLGLSIVLQLALLLGGKVDVESKPGEGSTFTITLPVQASREKLQKNNPYLQSMPQELATAFSSSYRPTVSTSPNLIQHEPELDTSVSDQCIVLAVDDNLDILNLINSSLENSPYKVVQVNDPLRVVELVQKLHPCAVTLDVMMPKLNGWQLLQQLKANPETASIPVIMLTVVSERPVATMLGADEYLMKPVERDVLLKTLHQLCKAS